MPHSEPETPHDHRLVGEDETQATGVGREGGADADEDPGDPGGHQSQGHREPVQPLVVDAHQLRRPLVVGRGPEPPAQLGAAQEELQPAITAIATPMVMSGSQPTARRLLMVMAVSSMRPARHYCYLEPGDALVERRVTTDVFFGNVLAELTDAAPELIGAATARYAAGLTELEETLRRAVGLGRPVVLIIDGLDHIARVRDGSDLLSAEDTDIVERLSLLDIPEGVALIVGSQPGGHLDVLRSRWGAAMAEEPVRQWPANDIEALATQYGVLDAIRAAGIADDDQ